MQKTKSAFVSIQKEKLILKHIQGLGGILKAL